MMLCAQPPLVRARSGDQNENCEEKTPEAGKLRPEVETRQDRERNKETKVGAVGTATLTHFGERADRNAN